jgi:starvation-inducible DNA-binding protein
VLSTKNSLPADSRKQVCTLLNQTVANLIDLQFQFRHAHWNVKGRHFYPLHKMFEEVYDMLEENLDVLAERLTALGGVVEGTVRMAGKNTKLAEFPDNAFDGDKAVAALIETTAQFGGMVRTAIDQADEAGDAGTADLLTKLVQDADKALWLLESQARH